MMARPTVEARTELIYARLPEHYRDADAGLDYPLLRYLSLLLDQLEPLDDLVDRIDAADTGTSDLVDADTANARWLPWLSQLLGVDLTGLTIDEQRAALADPAASWDHGTPDAIADAVRAGLTGTKAVVITPHHTGNPWLIGIGTKDSETAGLLDTFAKLKTAAPTWGDLEALNTFENAATSAPVRDAEVERPSGYKLVRYSTGA